MKRRGLTATRIYCLQNSVNDLICFGFAIFIHIKQVWFEVPFEPVRMKTSKLQAKHLAVLKSSVYYYFHGFDLHGTAAFPKKLLNYFQVERFVIFHTELPLIEEGFFEVIPKLTCLKLYNVSVPCFCSMKWFHDWLISNQFTMIFNGDPVSVYPDCIHRHAILHHAVKNCIYNYHAVKNNP